jgi:hypothetical protein
VAPGDLVISELCYNPPGTDEAEFVELLNVADHAINLRGVCFSDGVEYAFAANFDTPLAPGQRLLLVSSLFTFQQLHGIDLPVAGVYFGNFDNDGEVAAIESATGTELLHLAYGDDSPWPSDADGAGGSLVFIPTQPGENLNDPRNWRTSVVAGGTPMASDSIPFTGDPVADLDDNGVPDLLDHALGTPAGSRSGMRMSIDAEGHLLVSMTRAIGADDVVMDIETSTDLTTWNGAIPFDLASRTPDGRGRDLLVFRSVDPHSDLHDHWFVRVRGTLR